MSNKLIKKALVTSIIVTYNGSKWIEKCINSLIETQIQSHNIIIVDNHSTDNTLSILKTKFYDKVYLIEEKTNHGFGKANNIGLKIAKEIDSQHVFLLNQDAWLTDNLSLKKLIETQSQNPNYGIISPIHVNTNGQVDKLFHSFLSKKQQTHLSICIDNAAKKELLPTNYINAASWLISNKCLMTVGGFMPIFEHYGEDNNYCDRVLMSGLSIGIATNVKIVHDRGKRKRKYIPKKIYKRLYIEHLSYLVYPIDGFIPSLIHFLKTMSVFLYSNIIRRPDKIILTPFVLLHLIKETKSIKNQKKESLKLGANFIT